MCEAFVIHLQSPAGAGFTVKHAKAHGRRLGHICQSLAGDEKEFTLMDLSKIMNFDKTGGLFDHWVSTGNNKAGSISNMFVTLKHFLKFAMHKGEYKHRWLSIKHSFSE